MVIFIDDRNKERYNRKESLLYNKQEIIRSVKSNAKFINLFIYLLGLPGLVLFSWITVSYINTRSDSIFISLICLAIIFYMWKELIYGAFIGYKWRKGISDQQIIDNLLQQGKIVEGEIIKITPNNLHFIYHNGGKFTGSKKTSTFITNHWEKFQVGDKVAVLYAHNVADCLL